MDWWQIFLTVLGGVIGILFAWMERNWIKEQTDRRRFFTFVNLAKEVVLWAKDAFPDLPGPEKFHNALKLFIEVARERGWDVSEKEAALHTRSAYQENIGIPDEEELHEKELVLMEAKQKAEELEKKF